MTAPLEEIFVAGEAVGPPEDLVRQWDLPESDRQALLRWGLPEESDLTPHFQAGADPELVPNVAGERERQVASPGDRLYTLVYWGLNEVRIGAVAGTGRVLKLQPKPTTVDDFPLAFREIYAGFYRPSVEFFGSSVAQFVEASWRWHAAGGIAGELWQDEPRNDRPWKSTRHGSAALSTASGSSWSTSSGSMVMSGPTTPARCGRKSSRSSPTRATETGTSLLYSPPLVRKFSSLEQQSSRS